MRTAGKEVRYHCSGHMRCFFLGLSISAVLALAACEGPLPTDAGPEQPSQTGPSKATGSASSVAAFYVHAHQDDWPLFMGNRTNASVKGGASVVFIYTTAGDGGLEDRYWQTREVAVQAAVDVITPPGSWSCAARTVNSHPIQRCQKSPAVVAYYMRMPGGNGSDGTGYGKGSLELLRDQATPTTAINGSTTYVTWQDFYTTLSQVIELEAADHAASSIEVHAPDYDRTINLDDHPDHLVTADAVRAGSVVATRNWTLGWYIDYQTRNLPVNLTDAEHAIKDSEFKAYDDVMVADGYEQLYFESWWVKCRWRTYFRTGASSPSRPSAPSNLAGQGVSPSEISITWTDNSANEAGFRVERAVDNAGIPGVFSLIATLGANVTSYRSAGLQSATTYWYRVQAFNDGGSSSYSNQASATTLAPSGAPSNLTVTRTVVKGNKVANLAWTRGTATSVDIWRSGRKLVSTANTGSYGDNLGKPGGTFTYQVCVAGKTTASDCSNTVSGSF
jgi:LmbE family N-acetylglucosaminyl deacetylase